MIKNFESWINENWLTNYRDIIIPAPLDNIQWKPVDGNVTAETKKLLKLVQGNVDELSIFSWHPNIPQSQYSDLDVYHGRSNFNSRLLISISLIIRDTTNPKTIREFDIYRILDKEFPYISVGGGNGDPANNSKQIQLSFLKGNVGTHEEAKKIKEATFTAGAYSFKGAKWLYIPAEEFDTSKFVENTINAARDMVKKFFDITFDKYSLREFKSIIPQSLDYTLEKGTKVRIEIGMKSNREVCFSGYVKNEQYRGFSQLGIKELLVFLHEQKMKEQPIIFTEDEMILLNKSDNIEDFLKIYIHNRRGSTIGKKFGV